MGLTSLQVCMDSSDCWLQGTIPEEGGMDSSSPSGGDILTCASRPLIERRLRPQHEQALKCPRCDSTHTKFCYYNNYSLSQPRYFCKTCRRYWTKGGTLRNIPVGGGCRKNKKVSTKKTSNDNHQNNPIIIPSSSQNPTDLQLSFPPEEQFSHLTNFLGSHGGFSTTAATNNNNPNFLLENPSPIDFMETKYEAFVGGSRNHDLGLMSSGLGDLGSSTANGLAPNFHGLFCASPFGMSSFEGSSSGVALLDSCQRLMLPYEPIEDQNAVDVKPNTKLLALEWPDQCCSDTGKDSFGYLNGLGSWTGLMNGYGPSTTNPLV